jgi:hypothetical protein
MLDLSKYRGISQFGRAYQIMMENDTHASGSVDRVLAQGMIQLCPETVAYLYGGYTPVQVQYEKGSRPELERWAEEAVADCHSSEEQIEGIVRFTSDLGKKVVDEDLDAMRFGGIEEEIIRRGSDWCTDVARVGCIMCQVVGLPARLVALFNTEQAYSGHVIIETYRGGIWAAVDPTTAVIYRHSGMKPASTWELMQQPQLIEAHWKDDGSTPYTSVGQFRHAAISNYFVSDWRHYDYTVSPINDYKRPILEMSMQGWPGGLRWLHGEDKA